MSTRSLDLKRSTAQLVVDHFMVHVARNILSVHVLEKNSDGAIVGGLDIDGVSVEEIGGTGEIAAAISGNRLVAFVQSASGGVPAKLDELPPPPKEEPKAEEASAGEAAAAP